MALVHIKCPNCGGAINLDKTMERAFCLFCGTHFIVKDDNAHMQHADSVTLANNIEPILRSAVGFCKLKRWRDATHLYQKMIVMNSTDYRGWWGLFLVKSRFMNAYHVQDGNHFLPIDISDARNAIEVAPPKAKVYLTQQLNAYLNKINNLCRVHIKFAYNLIFDQSTISIQIDQRKVAFFQTDKPVILMIPKGPHIIKFYGAERRRKTYKLNIVSHTVMTVKCTSGYWSIVAIDNV